jgi:hypothetical protein
MHAQPTSTVDFILVFLLSNISAWKKLRHAFVTPLPVNDCDDITRKNRFNSNTIRKQVWKFYLQPMDIIRAKAPNGDGDSIQLSNLVEAICEDYNQLIKAKIHVKLLNSVGEINA